MLKIELCHHLEQAETNKKERKLINSMNRNRMTMKISDGFTVFKIRINVHCKKIDNKIARQYGH